MPQALPAPHVRVLAGCVLLTLISCTLIRLPSALADEVTDAYGVSTPEAAWAYFKFPDAGHNFDPEYVPARSDISSAEFLGFVTTPADGIWGGAEFSGTDTVYVFTTVVQSTTPVTIPLVWDGDDGHAVFVNGEFVGGGGFAEDVPFDLAVAPGASVTLEVVGYNAGGPWVLKLLRRDTGLPLTSTPGVTIDACTANVPSDACAEVTTVSIDIKPGSSPNTINPKSQGVIPVAILTTKIFDATTVDPLSVRFGPKGAQEAHDKGHIRDVNKDGEPDLVLHFRTQATGIQCGDTSASLMGETFDGDPIQGSDTIETVGCKQ
jgi:hypothetical protein